MRITVNDGFIFQLGKKNFKTPYNYEKTPYTHYMRVVNV